MAITYRQPLVAYAYKVDGKKDPNDSIRSWSYHNEWFVDHDWTVDLIMLVPPNHVLDFVDPVNLPEMQVVRGGTLGFPLAPQGLRCGTESIDDYLRWLFFPVSPTSHVEVFTQLRQAISQDYDVILDLDQLGCDDPVTAAKMVCAKVPLAGLQRIVIAWRPNIDMLLLQPEEAQLKCQLIRACLARCASASTAERMRIILIDDTQRLGIEGYAHYVINPDIDGVLYWGEGEDEIPIQACKLAHKLAEFKRNRAGNAH